MDTIKMQVVNLPNVSAVGRAVKAANSNLPRGEHLTVPGMRAAATKVLRFLPPIPREDPPDDVA